MKCGWSVIAITCLGAFVSLFSLLFEVPSLSVIASRRRSKLGGRVSNGIYEILGAKVVRIKDKQSGFELLELRAKH